MKSISDFLLFITPFFNEFANLFTLTFFLPLYKLNLYAHHPHSMMEVFIKSLIDMIALTGIAANASHVASQESDSELGFELGVVKAFLYLVFAFMIPNLFMEDFLNMLPKNNMTRLAAGIVLIYLLDVCVHTCYCVYYKSIEHKKQKSE
jgi:uncharacterized membrane protein